jgi:hypothetical protein
LWDPVVSAELNAGITQVERGLALDRSNTGRTQGTEKPAPKLAPLTDLSHPTQFTLDYPFLYFYYHPQLVICLGKAAKALDHGSCWLGIELRQI